MGNFMVIREGTIVPNQSKTSQPIHGKHLKMKLAMISFLERQHYRFPNYLTPTAEKFDGEVDTWTTDCRNASINPDDLESLYQKALEIRRRDNPKNHYPLVVTELISANEEILFERAEAARMERL